jgi:hypothetical protein
MPQKVVLINPADAVDPQAAVQAIIAARFPAIAAAHAAGLPRIRVLERRLLAEDEQGIDNSALRQAVREWRWRLEYTGDAAAAEAAGGRAERLAALPVLPAGGSPNADGSFGGDTEVWFLKLDASIDHLLAPDCDIAPPRFLDRVNDPVRLEGYLDGLLVSRPELDGIDRRKELNLATANLVRLILWRRPRGYPWDPRLAPVIHDFIGRWQDPETGFFGARYEIAGRRFQTTDLSMTFHMARYLDGEIGCWPLLVDTLLRIRDRRYPNGWLDEDGITAHNAYDVATLFRLGWRHMDSAQRLRAAVELARFSGWCLSTALASDGRVMARARGEALPESYYFTIALLDAAGFFDPAPFWRQQPFAEAAALRPLLARQLRRLAPGNAMTRMALARLRTAGAAAAQQGAGT